MKWIEPLTMEVRGATRSGPRARHISSDEVRVASRSRSATSPKTSSGVGADAPDGFDIITRHGECTGRSRSSARSTASSQGAGIPATWPRTPCSAPPWGPPRASSGCRSCGVRCRPPDGAGLLPGPPGNQERAAQAARSLVPRGVPRSGPQVVGHALQQRHRVNILDPYLARHDQADRRIVQDGPNAAGD